MQFPIRLSCLVYLFNFHSFPTAESSKTCQQISIMDFPTSCMVHFGVQSNISFALLDAFLDSFQLNRQDVLDRENSIHGNCTDLAHCSIWKLIERYPSPSRWKYPVFRHLRCGKKEDDGTVLFCCPEVKEVSDTSRIVFPDESSYKEGTAESSLVNYNMHPNRCLLPGLNPNDCPTKMPSMGRIFGGNSARLGQYPWIVRLAYKSSDRGSFSNSRDLDDGGSSKIDFRCGGVLLNDRYVLTAAHCLRDTIDRVYMVRLGELDERSNPDCEPAFLGGSSYGARRLLRCADRIVDVPVDQSIVHERYDVPYRQNDIALLRLNASIKLTDWIRPICLPFDWPTLLHSRTSLDPVLVGWGRDDSFQFAENLQQVRLGWYNTTECSSIYSNAHPRSISISESLQFCLGGGREGDVEGGGGRDACQGDSGGPVMLTGLGDGIEGERVYTVGIISFGPLMCGNGYPSVYTWVPSYLTWILDNIVA